MSLPRNAAVALVAALMLLLPPTGTRPAAAQTAPPNEVGCTTFDATGDTRDLGTNNPRPEPRADVTQLCVDYGYALRIAVVVAQPTDPASDPGWGEGGDSRLEVGIDTDDDPEFELRVTAEGDDFSAVRATPTGPALCAAPFFALAAGYAVEISRNCLGTDSVAVSVLMVYDPAPAPTTGPLVADLAPDTGFVPLADRNAPAAPQPLAGAAAPVCSPDEANDTIDEASQPVEFDAADILETCVQHGATEVRLTARMRRPTDPQSEPVWRARSGVGWEIDTDNDLAEDFTISFLDVGVFVEPDGNASLADLCRGTPGFDGTFLVLHVPRSCLGNPQYVAARPFSVFARINRIEPEPPLALDTYRFPGFSPLVGAPGVTVPTQATTPGTPGTTGGGATTTTTTGQTTTTRVASRSSSGARVSQTAARSELADTGTGLDPAAWALGLVGFGLALVALSRRRVTLGAVGPWDLLPAPRAPRIRRRGGRG